MKNKKIKKSKSINVNDLRLISIYKEILSELKKIESDIDTLVESGYVENKVLSNLNSDLDKFFDDKDGSFEDLKSRADDVIDKASESKKAPNINVSKKNVLNTFKKRLDLIEDDFSEISKSIDNEIKSMGVEDVVVSVASKDLSSVDSAFSENEGVNKNTPVSKSTQMSPRSDNSPISAGFEFGDNLDKDKITDISKGAMGILGFSDFDEEWGFSEKIASPIESINAISNFFPSITRKNNVSESINADDEIGEISVPNQPQMTTEGEVRSGASVEEEYNDTLNMSPKQATVKSDHIIIDSKRIELSPDVLNSIKSEINSSINDTDPIKYEHLVAPLKVSDDAIPELGKRIEKFSKTIQDNKISKSTELHEGSIGDYTKLKGINRYYDGGIVTKKEELALLHGPEAVIPLKDGNIPVDIKSSIGVKNISGLSGDGKNTSGTENIISELTNSDKIEVSKVSLEESAKNKELIYELNSNLKQLNNLNKTDSISDFKSKLTTKEKTEYALSLSEDILDIGRQQLNFLEEQTSLLKGIEKNTSKSGGGFLKGLMSVVYSQIPVLVGKMAGEGIGGLVSTFLGIPTNNFAVIEDELDALVSVNIDELKVLKMIAKDTRRLKSIEQRYGRYKEPGEINQDKSSSIFSKIKSMFSLKKIEETNVTETPIIGSTEPTVVTNNLDQRVIPSNYNYLDRLESPNQFDLDGSKIARSVFNIEDYFLSKGFAEDQKDIDALINTEPKVFKRSTYANQFDTIVSDVTSVAEKLKQSKPFLESLVSRSKETFSSGKELFKIDGVKSDQDIININKNDTATVDSGFPQSWTPSYQRPPALHTPQSIIGDVPDIKILPEFQKSEPVTGIKTKAKVKNVSSESVFKINNAISGLKGRAANFVSQGVKSLPLVKDKFGKSNREKPKEKPDSIEVTEQRKSRELLQNYLDFDLKTSIKLEEGISDSLNELVGKLDDLITVLNKGIVTQSTNATNGDSDSVFGDMFGSFDILDDAKDFLGKKKGKKGKKSGSKPKKVKTDGSDVKPKKPKKAETKPKKTKVADDATEVKPKKTKVKTDDVTEVKPKKTKIKAEDEVADIKPKKVKTKGSDIVDDVVGETTGANKISKSLDEMGDISKESKLLAGESKLLSKIPGLSSLDIASKMSALKESSIIKSVTSSKIGSKLLGPLLGGTAAAGTAAAGTAVEAASKGSLMSRGFDTLKTGAKKFVGIEGDLSSTLSKNSKGLLENSFLGKAKKLKGAGVAGKLLAGFGLLNTALQAKDAGKVIGERFGKGDIVGGLLETGSFATKATGVGGLLDMVGINADTWIRGGQDEFDKAEQIEEHNKDLAHQVKMKQIEKKKVMFQDRFDKGKLNSEEIEMLAQNDTEKFISYQKNLQNLGLPVSSVPTSKNEPANAYNISASVLTQSKKTAGSPGGTKDSDLKEIYNNPDIDQEQSIAMLLTDKTNKSAAIVVQNFKELPELVSKLKVNENPTILSSYASVPDVSRDLKEQEVAEAKRRNAGANPAPIVIQQPAAPAPQAAGSSKSIKSTVDDTDLVLVNAGLLG